MKNTTFFKVISVFSVAIFALSASTASAAVYYDQVGQAHYYDTYTVPGGQLYPPVQYGYASNGMTYGIVQGGSYGYSTGYGYNGGSYGNRQPSIFSSPVRDAIAGQAYVAGINASDPDHDALTYSLINGPTGMTIDSVTGLLRWNDTAGKAGQTFPVSVGVTDGRSPIVTQSFSITVRSYGWTGSSNSGSSNSSGSTSSNSSKSVTVGGPSYTGSIFSTFFGGGSSAKGISITDVNVTSGPKNINDTADRNCNVYVSWKTNTATAGQVVYGTASQQSIDSYAYPNTAPEGNAYTKSHQVQLGCLTNTSTYFFRIVAFSASDRAITPEYTIFPVTIRTQIPQSGGFSASTISTTDDGSFGSQLLHFIFHPITFILVGLALVIWIVVVTLRWMNGRGARIRAANEAAKASAHAAPQHGAHAAHGAPGPEIPMLAVPHH